MSGDTKPPIDEDRIVNTALASWRRQTRYRRPVDYAAAKVNEARRAVGIRQKITGKEIKQQILARYKNRKKK